MSRCPRLQSGGELTPAAWDRFAVWLDAELRAREIQPGVGYSYTASRGGFSLSINGGGSSKPALQPFDIQLSSATSGDQATIVPGLVAGIIPSNIFTEFTINDTLTYFICKLSTDGTKITAAEILTDSNPPSPPTLIPSALPSEVKFVFGLTKDGKAFRTIGNGNPVVSSSLAIQTDKLTTPPVGVPGVDRWYNLIVS
jgi:hypothetical protein